MHRLIYGGFLWFAGVRLESQPAVLALQSFSALTRLDLTRCGVAAAGIAAIAATVPSLQELNLSENGVLRSFTELRSLQQLSRLTKLDVSSPSTAMRMPDSEHTAVCELTQLRHLALNSVMLTRRCVWLLQCCSTLCLMLTAPRSLCLSYPLCILQSWSPARRPGDQEPVIPAYGHSNNGANGRSLPARGGQYIAQLQ